MSGPHGAGAPNADGTEAATAEGSKSRGRTVAGAVVDALAAAGVSTLFCVPGVHTDGFLTSPELARAAIRPLHTRHEQGCGFMAVGAAMASGRVHALCIVPGPGLLNAAAAVATARGTSAPVVVIVGGVEPSEKGTGALHDLPGQDAVLGSITKAFLRLREPADSSQIRHIVGMATAAPPGAVAIEVPQSLWGHAAAAPSSAAEGAPAGCAIDDLAAATEVLARSRSPLIVVGGGAQDAGAEVLRLAEHLGAPVLANRMGRGVIDGRHALAATVLEGPALWAATDVVVGVGTRLRTPLRWGARARRDLVRIGATDGSDVGLGGGVVELGGDVTRTLGALCDAVERHTPTRTGRRAEVAAHRLRSVDRLREFAVERAHLDAIHAALPPEAVVVEDLTQLGYLNRVVSPARRPRTVLHPGPFGSLGWAFPSAIGAKIAEPGRPVVALTGDGGYLFCAQELATAVHHRISTVTVIFDDGAYGNVLRSRVERGQSASDCVLTNPDFVAHAESFGAIGLRARTPEELRRALEASLDAQLPVIIHVPVGPLRDPWPLLLGT